MGALKLPLEQAVTKRLREEKLLSAPPALSLREGLGQAGFAASLGGLRSLVASITVLQTVDAFENVDWGKVDGLYRIATQLQPRYAPYWVQAAEHMAFDAASSYRFDQNRRYALSEELFENHVRRGIEIMREGLRFNPDSARLWTRLGDIYSQRSGRSVIPGDRHAPLTGDPANAAECYLKGSELGALPIYERLGAYELVKAGDSGSLERARVILMRHYQRGHKPFRVIKDLKIIEEKLQVPPAQRIQDQLPKPGR
jgi:hypothetical protein